MLFHFCTRIKVTRMKKLEYNFFSLKTKTSLTSKLWQSNTCQFLGQALRTKLLLLSKSLKTCPGRSTQYRTSDYTESTSLWGSLSSLRVEIDRKECCLVRPWPISSCPSYYNLGARCVTQEIILEVESSAPVTSKFAKRILDKLSICMLVWVPSPKLQARYSFLLNATTFWNGYTAMENQVSIFRFSVDLNFKN